MSVESAAGGPLCLNPNVDIVAVAEYPAEVREQLGGLADDFVLSERRSRYAAHRIDRETADFIRRFREPKSLAEAVVEHGIEQAEDPQRLLAKLFPLIARLRAERILVVPGAAAPVQGEPRFAPGERIGAYEIETCIEAQAETEVYRAHGPSGEKAAVKWIPADAHALVRSSLRRESEILRRLEAASMPATPRVLQADTEAVAPFLAISWCEGQDLLAWSRDLTRPMTVRVQVAERLIGIYAALHGRGVLHGDVHPRNVLVAADGQVSVVDFGAARVAGASEDRPRVGLLPDFEPEAAQAALGGDPLPLSSLVGEQYAVAAMVFRVVTGSAPLRLSLESQVALRQIAEHPPRRFAELDLSWPAVETVLARALAKDPNDRWASLADLAEAFSAAAADPPRSRPTRAPPPKVSPSTLVADYGLESACLANGLARGPTASLYYGAAGIAWALLRAAVLREEPAALAAAEVWIQRAVADLGRPHAFEGPEVGVTSDLVGAHALFSAEPGVRLTQALIRHAEGDGAGFALATRAFVAAAGRASEAVADFPLDLMNGPAGLLLGASQLHALCDRETEDLRRSFVDLGDRLAAWVSRDLAAAKEGRPGEPPYLGVAHGAAGSVYALLGWQAARPGGAQGEAVRVGLQWLTEQGRNRGSGLEWPLRTGPDGGEAWTGWCHGSAGYILLWSAAAQATEAGGAEVERALQAGEFLWARQAGSGPSLCCGQAGQALSLFELGRLTGKSLWFDRGRALLAAAAQAPFHPLAPHSLYRGRLGLALAQLEASDPARSVWPVCQSPL
jgi:serine/threonine protein kinase